MTHSLLLNMLQAFSSMVLSETNQMEHYHSINPLYLPKNILRVIIKIGIFKSRIRYFKTLKKDLFCTVMSLTQEGFSGHIPPPGFPPSATDFTHEAVGAAAVGRPL